MRIHRLNSSVVTLVLGLTITVLGYQNCSKARFVIDDVAKQKALGDGSIFDHGDDGNIAGNTPGDDGSIPGGKNPGDDGSIPKGNVPGDDSSIPKTPGTTPKPTVTPTPVNGNDPKVPGTTPTPTPVPGDDSSTTSTSISLVPNSVCGPAITNNQAMLPTAKNVVAVLYKSSNFPINMDTKMIQAWDSAADTASIRAQLAGLKPFSLKVSSKLAAGNYSVMMYDAAKVKAPYVYSWQNSQNVVAPVADTITHFADQYSTFTVNSAGKQVSPQTMNVVVGSQGDPACATAGSIDPLILQLKTEKPQPIVLTGPEDGVMFDILGQKADHKKVKVSWFASGETENYFLVLPDSRGEVLGIDELFGDATLGPDKKFAKQGFAALAKHDDNRDNVISSDDEVFLQLRLWKDLNLDGIVQASELWTLEEKGVVAIDLRYDKRYKETDKHGNMTKFKSIVVMKDNSYGLVYDLWLRYLAK